MRILGLNIKRIKPEERTITIGPSTSIGLPWGGTTTTLSAAQAMKLSAVYRCVDVRSDSIATMPQDIFVKERGEWIKDEDHPAYSILNISPNPSCSSFVFRKALMAMVDLNGNGYARIYRDDFGNPLKLELLTGSVTMYLKDDLTIYYEYQNPYNYNTIRISGDDMIHVKNFSYDGLLGTSVLTHATNITGLAQSADGQAKGFFDSGANMSGILTVPGKIDSIRASQLKTALSQALKLNSNTGVAGGIVVMEGGAEFKSIQINPKDAQMIETRGFNVIDICRFFGVSPIKAFDLSSSTYANVESYQLGYITDTVTPLATMFDNEFNRKLFRPSMRNNNKTQLRVKYLLSSDLDTQANYFARLFPLGVFSPDDICRDLGLPIDPNGQGNKRYVMVNLTELGKEPTPTQNKNINVVKTE